MGVAALYCGLILWRLYVRLDSPEYPLKTYADIAERLLGKTARHVCTVLQTIQLIVNVSVTLSAATEFSYGILHFTYLGRDDLLGQWAGSFSNEQKPCMVFVMWIYRVIAYEALALFFDLHRSLGIRGHDHRPNPHPEGE